MQPCDLTEGRASISPLESAEPPSASHGAKAAQNSFLMLTPSASGPGLTSPTDPIRPGDIIFLNNFAYPQIPFKVADFLAVPRLMMEYIDNCEKEFDSKLRGTNESTAAAREISKMLNLVRRIRLEMDKMLLDISTELGAEHKANTSGRVDE